MTNTVAAAGAETRRMGLPARFVGIITSPKATFASVVAHPRWFGMMALITLVLAALVGGFLFTQVGQDAWVEAATTGPMAPREMSDQQYDGIVRMSRFAGYMGVAQMVIMVPLMTIITSGILFAVFNAAMGGDASFKQLFAVVTHAGVISVVGQMFTVPMNYMRGTMSSATNVKVLLPMIDDKAFLGRLLSMIDLFIIWWVVVLAIGLAVLYRRKTQPIATTLFVIYGVIAIVAAAIMSGLGGGN